MMIPRPIKERLIDLHQDRFNDYARQQANMIEQLSTDYAMFDLLSARMAQHATILQELNK